MESVDERNREYYYIEGNAARKIATAPVREERPERKQDRRTNEKIQRNAKRAKAFDLQYTIALVTATAFLFVSCISMLTLKANVTEQRRQIAMLESDLNTLTDNNNETSKRLESSVDFPKIYEFATTELGMTYPKKGQVVSYEASNPDYVKQFKDVPTE